MYIDKETNTIHIALGNDYKYISSIILNDGTKLLNKQCTLLEPVPTHEQLQEFENKVKDTFKSDHKAELENLKRMGLIK